MFGTNPSFARRMACGSPQRRARRSARFVVGGLDAQQREPGRIVAEKRAERTAFFIGLIRTAELTVHRRDIGISNTLAWSPDRRRFYFGDSLANMIWSYDYDPATGDDRE